MVSVFTFFELKSTETHTVGKARDLIVLMVPEILLRLKTIGSIGEHPFVAERSLESLCGGGGGREDGKMGRGEGRRGREKEREGEPQRET